MNEHHDSPDERDVLDQDVLDQDVLDQLVEDDPANRRVAAALRSWRADNAAAHVDPDARLGAMFAQEPAPAQPSRWRQWMQRPAIAFGASFAAVLVLGAGALAVVANSDGAGDVAASTSSAIPAQEVTSQVGAISLPDDLSEQTGYASCVFDQLTEWFGKGFGQQDTPQILDTCGSPPIPDLGPEAEAFRGDLQVWADCAASELQALLPQLPDLIKEGGDEPDPLGDCGDPPDPRDYGLELPFLDFGEIDPSKFDFGPFNLDEFKLKFEEFDIDEFNIDELDIDELLAKLPAGFLPDDLDLENLDLEEFKGLFEGFEKGEFEGFNFDGLKLEELLGQLDDLNLEGLEDLDLKSLFDQFEVEGLEGELDFDQLMSELFGGDLDLSSFLDELANQGT